MPTPASPTPSGLPPGVDASRTEVVLVSNGPGELYTWAKPVLHEVQRRLPEARVTIALIPCQFASGGEAEIARGFGADHVTTPGEYLRTVALGRRLPGVGERETGFVLSLGGNAAFAVRIGRQVGYPVYRYSFEPAFVDGVDRLFVPDEAAARTARRARVPAECVDVVGNLVADAVHEAEPVPNPGRPHVLLFGGSRAEISRRLLPLVFGVAEALGARYPDARFVWPVSALLPDDVISDGIAGTHAALTGGISARRSGDEVITPNGTVVEMSSEADRYRHMASADLALTIPGTNTLELGVAHVPSVVILPLNIAGLFPLEGPLHWIGSIPGIGRPIKRGLVRTYVRLRGLRRPTSLPNRLTGETLFTEVRGDLDVAQVAGACADLLDDEARQAWIRQRLEATMPSRGATARLVQRILETFPADRVAPA